MNIIQSSVSTRLSLIYTPALEYFRLYDFVAEGYDLKNLNSLTEAQLHVELSIPKLEQKGYAYNGQRHLELMKGICSVKVLHLTGDYMEISIIKNFLSLD